MNYFGTYHADAFLRSLGICDAPRTSKGQMTIAGFDTASEKDIMAMVRGRMRNRASLARELGCAPYASAAQVVLRAYQKWGCDYPKHIEGPCVSCVADVAGDTMIVARDRMGECSLFYAWREKQLMFADHPDVLLKTAFLRPVLDREGACELLGIGPARSPGRTPVRGLMALEPGCMLICHECRLEIRRYFTLETAPSQESPEEAAEHVRALLEMAVNDVVHLHPACMLSGGVDSTALTALLCARIGRIDSFSVDYDGNERDFISNAFRPEKDSPYIILAARLFGTRHRQIVLTQDALAAGLDPAMRLRGFPGMADIDSSLMLFAKEILRHAPYVISGECGDEVFGGYPWFRGEPELPSEAFPWSGSVELREGVLRKELREKLKLRDYVRDTLHGALEGYDVSNVQGEGEKNLFRLQRLCFDYFMPNLQERAVCMCGGQGLEVLTPLCDERLVQYVYNVPWKIKTMGNVEKGLYRQAVKDLLPDKLRLRRKSPYPKTCSPAYTEAVRGLVRVMISDTDAPVWKLLDREAVEKLASSGLDPAATPWYGQLMAGPQMLAYLIQVNSWLRERDIQIEIE